MLGLTTPWAICFGCVFPIRGGLPGSGRLYRSLAPDTTFDSVVRGAMKPALDYLSEGQAEIIVGSGEYETISGKKPQDFPCRSWSTIKDSMVVHESHPWRTGQGVTKAGDQGYVPGVHSDRYFLPNQQNQGRSILHRGPAGPAGILSTLPNTYLWSPHSGRPAGGCLSPAANSCTDQPNTYCVPWCTIPCTGPMPWKPVCCKKYAQEYPKYF